MRFSFRKIQERLQHKSAMLGTGVLQTEIKQTIFFAHCIGLYLSFAPPESSLQNFGVTLPCFAYSASDLLQGVNKNASSRCLGFYHNLYVFLEMLGPI